MQAAYFELQEKRPDLFVNDDTEQSIRIVTDKKEARSIEKQLNTKIGIMYKDQYITLLKDPVRFPNGNNGTYFRIISSRKAEGTVIFPVINGKILLLKHYRHSIRQFQLEVPRGFGEDDLTPEENVCKEMREETGVEPSSIVYLGRAYPDTGILGTSVVFYYAKLEAADFHDNDDEEAIAEYVLVTKDELTVMIANGEICDGFTIQAFAFATAKNLM